MRILQALNLLAFAAMVIVNYMAVFLPINGQTTGEIARQYPSLFIPAAFVFTIWRLIYILLAGFMVYQAGGFFRIKPEHPRLLARVSIFFVLSSAANIGWIFAWHSHHISLALAMNTVLLLSLSIIYWRLGIGRVKVERREWLLTRLPFSIYLGWITISTVGNLSIYLVSVNWDGWGLSQTFWTALAILSLSILAVLFLWRYRDRAYALTFVWVFLGVIYQRFVLGDPSHYSIGVTAAIAAVVLLAVVFLFKTTKKNLLIKNEE